MIKSSFVINYYDEAGYVENNFIDANAKGLVSSPVGAMTFDTMEDAQSWIDTQAADNQFDPEYCEIQPVDGEIESACHGKSKKSKKPIKSVKVYDEMYFKDFKPWSGAVSTFDRILEEGKEDVMDDFLDEMYPDGISSTELNDLLWFEPEYVFEVCGISDYEDDEDNEDGEIESACHGKSKKAKKPVKSGRFIKQSLIEGFSDEDLKLLAAYADRAFEDVDFFYDSDEGTLAEHDYDQSELYKAQSIAVELYNVLNEISSSRKSVKSGKELDGKQKDDFIKKAMKKQGYSTKEADRMVSQSRHR